jgi:hypothetical protein
MVVTDDDGGGSGGGGLTDARVLGWMSRCRELASSRLEGIEDPARQLADLADGDRVLMERARRVLQAALDKEPRNPTLVQMEALWRRAFEKGEWGWEPSGLERSRYLS